MGAMILHLDVMKIRGWLPVVGLVAGRQDVGGTHPKTINAIVGRSTLCIWFHSQTDVPFDGRLRETSADSIRLIGRSRR